MNIGRSPARMIVGVAATIMAIGLIYIVIATAFARSSLANNNRPEAALWAFPWSSEAADAQGAALADQGRFEDVSTMARRLISLSPLDAAGSRLLAIAYQKQGDAGSADRLLLQAGRLNWRDPKAQYMIAERENERGNLAEAALHADALLRQTYYQPELFPYLRGIMLVPHGSDIVAARLAVDPSWRKDFLTQIDDIPVEIFAAHEKLLFELAQSPNAPTEDEINAFLNRLFDAGDYASAQSLALSLKPSLRPDGILQDGRFERFGHGGPIVDPFAWQGSHGGIDVLQVADAGHGLHVASDRPVSIRLLSKLFYAPPGSYYLMWEVSGPSARRADVELAWHIGCYGGDAVKADTDLTRTVLAPDRQVLRAAFSIPPTGCPVQKLDLSVDHGSGNLDLIVERTAIVHQ